MSDTITRGEKLLKPFGLALEDVQAISLSRKKFENAATARQFAKLHGMTISKMGSTPHHYIIEVRPVDKFEADSLTVENISRDVSVSAGVRKNIAQPAQDFDLVIDVDEPLSASDQEMTEAASSQDGEMFHAATKIGELFRIAKQDEADDAPVRTIGIVLKPEDADSQGSLISAEEIEQANLGFMRDFGTVGLMHQSSVSDRVSIIQNVIAPCDITFDTPNGPKVVTKGTWYQEHYTADPEIASKIRSGKLTGLSIGGLANHVDLAKQSFSHVAKSAGLEPVAKGEATHRLVNLSVQEVSLVDVAANEERFLVIRRKQTTEPVVPSDGQQSAAPVAAKEDSMSVQETPQAASAPAEVAPPVASTQESVAVEPVTKTEDSAPQVAPVAPAAAPAEPVAVQPDLSAIVAEAVTKALAAALAPLTEKVATLETQLTAQAEVVQKSAVVLASAKSESPAVTEAVTKSENQSIWAGTVIHRSKKSK